MSSDNRLEFCANADEIEFVDEPRLFVSVFVELEADAKNLPPASRFIDGWNIGKPDVVISMPEVNVPAEGSLTSILAFSRTSKKTSPCSLQRYGNATGAWCIM